jgi:hypothetical protein
LHLSNKISLQTRIAVACASVLSVFRWTIRNIFSGMVIMVATPFLASATSYDLSPVGSQSFNLLGAFGGTAIVADYWSQPTGTGVFDPFLTLDANGQTSTGDNKIEQAYNADGYNQLYLDGLRPNWNTTLRVGDLASITLNQIDYFGFILDANEPGGAKSTISVDNIRIYTSATDNTAAVGDNLSLLDNLGALRWAMNDPTTNPNGTFNNDTWIKLDASQENISRGANGGSGMSDMIIYIPQVVFTGAAATDYVWFYNLNGVHYEIDSDLATTAGFEEWSAVVGPQYRVPDHGDTLLLLGTALLALGICVRRLGFASKR